MTRKLITILSLSAFVLVAAPLAAYSKMKKEQAQVEASKVAAAQDGSEIPLDPYFKDLQWKARVLVITGDYRDSRTKRQIDELRKNIDGLKSRNVAVIRFVTDSIYEMEEFSDYGFRDWYDMNAHQQRFVESSIGADNNVFSVVLIGKDGAKKSHWVLDEIEGREADIITLGEIFAAIDSMPMAEREKAARENKK